MIKYINNGEDPSVISNISNDTKSYTIEGDFLPCSNVSVQLYASTEVGYGEPAEKVLELAPDG